MNIKELIEASKESGAKDLTNQFTSILIAEGTKVLIRSYEKELLAILNHSNDKDLSLMVWEMTKYRLLNKELADIAAFSPIESICEKAWNQVDSSKVDSSFLFFVVRNAKSKKAVEEAWKAIKYRPLGNKQGRMCAVVGYCKVEYVAYEAWTMLRDMSLYNILDEHLSVISETIAYTSSLKAAKEILSHVLTNLHGKKSRLNLSRIIEYSNFREIKEMAFKRLSLDLGIQRKDLTNKTEKEIMLELLDFFIASPEKLITSRWNKYEKDGENKHTLLSALELMIPSKVDGFYHKFATLIIPSYSEYLYDCWTIEKLRKLRSEISKASDTTMFDKYTIK